jgi:hypothetical protein
MIGMRAQGEAKRAIANNQLIPLPEPARRGLLNLGDDLIATANQAVAAAALLDTGSTRLRRRDAPASPW